MKRPSAAMTAKWEARLKAEGMPAEFHTSRRQSLSDVSVSTPDGGDITASSTYQHWTAMSHAVYALPRNYKGRAFLIVFVETGYFKRACDETNTSWRQGRNILARFAQTMKDNNESDPTD